MHESLEGLLSAVPRLRLHGRSGDDRGATGVEYALLVAAVSGLIVGGVYSVGRESQEVFSYVCTTITAETGQGNRCGSVRRRVCPPPANNPACTNRVGGNNSNNSNRNPNAGGAAGGGRP